MYRQVSQCLKKFANANRNHISNFFNSLTPSVAPFGITVTKSGTCAGAGSM